ncbi:MAG: cytochrome c [Sedimenticola sp.]|nr:cytochrome c [Sedimenticola sp.]
MNNLYRKHFLVLFIAVLVLTIQPLTLMAHGKATGIVKQRMELMKKIEKQMRSISIMEKGKLPYDATRISQHAEMIRRSSSKIPALFPEGSLHKPTEALPVIWEQWDQFLDETNLLEQEAAELQALATEGDKQAVLEQFNKLEKSCSRCHEIFRLED